MNFATYNATVLEWKKLYPFKPVIEPYDPTTDKRGCIRCSGTRKLSRHHKANDFWFACLRPDLYAARYIQFLKADVALLCDRCHKLVHTHYRKMMEQVLASVTYIGETPIYSQAWCDYWMQQFREWFEKWIKKPYTKRKRKRGKTKARRRNGK